MINIPEELRYLYKNDVLPKVREIANKQLQITFHKLGITIGNDRIKHGSFELTESLCSTEDITFGACESAQFKITVADLPQDVTRDVITVTQVVNDTYTMPLGTYIVDSAILQSDKRFKEITAYDYMSKLDIDVTTWYNGLSFPITIKNMRESLLNHVGLQFDAQTLINDSVTIEKTVNPSYLKGRDVMVNLVSLNGGFGHITRDNKFKVIQLSGIGLYPSETLYPSEDLFPSESTEFLGHSGYITSDYEEYYVEPITGLRVTESDDDYGTLIGTTENVYLMQGNFLLFGASTDKIKTIAEEILLNIKNKRYRPHVTQMLGLPYIEVGDTINIMTTDDAIETFVFKRTLTGIQALRDDISASGNVIRDNTPTYNTEIQQLKGKTLKITKSVDLLSTELTNVEEGLTSQITQTASEINTRITNVESDLSSSITQTASSLQTQITDNKQNAESLITQNAEEIALKVSKGDVSSEISVETGLISIRGNRLEIDSSNFKLYQNGNARFSGDIVGASFSGGSISGTNISGTNITGGKITGNEIIGSSFTSSQNMGSDTVTLSMEGVNFSIAVRPNSNPSQLIANMDIGHSGILFESSVNRSYWGRGLVEYIYNNSPIFSIDGSNLLIKGSSPVLDSNINSKVTGIVTPSYISSNMPTQYTSSIRISSGSTSGQIGFYNGNAVGWDYAERTYQKSSDLRLKFDIQELKDIKDFYLDLKPKSYRFKDGFDYFAVNTGLIADEVLSNLQKHNIKSGMVYESVNVYNQDEFCPDGHHYNLKYEDLHSFHIKMIQNHEHEIEELKLENEQQREELQNVKKTLESLTKLLLEKGVI